MQKSKRLSVAAIQMLSLVAKNEQGVNNAIQQNLETVRRLVEQAASAGAKLIVLPENVLTFASRKEFSLNEQCAWLQAFSEIAKNNSVWLVAGSLPLFNFRVAGSSCRVEQLHWLQVSGLPYASSVLFDSAGEVRALYQKNHLFDANVGDATGIYRESDFFQRGKDPVVVDTPWGKMGMAICFDLRFPRYFQNLRDMGADFVVLPSAFTFTTGSAHWEILVRARAIENQLAVIGVNQGGEHDSQRKTWGDSMIVDAWGNVVSRVANTGLNDDSQLGESIVLGELDLSMQEGIRARMPLISL